MRHARQCVYNFCVEGLPCYAVGDAEVLVHNNSGGTPPGPTNGGKPTPPKITPKASSPGDPFPGFPQGGRNLVNWGKGAADALKRAGQITADEAKLLDPAKVRQAKAFYEGVFKDNPGNLAAGARVQLMDRILELQGGPIN